MVAVDRRHRLAAPLGVGPESSSSAVDELLGLGSAGTDTPAGAHMATLASTTNVAPCGMKASANISKNGGSRLRAPNRRLGMIHVKIGSS